MHASKCGSGRMDAGGCAPGAWAEEPVWGRGVNEAVCSQLPAVMSDVWRTYRLVMYAKARVVFPVSAVSSIMVITARPLQSITPAMTGKVKKNLQMPDLCP